MKRIGTYFRPLDALVIALVLTLACLLAVLPLTGGGDAARLSVSVGGRESSYPLDTDCAFTLENNGYTLSVVILNGGVYVRDANCPRRHCLSMSPIKKSGEIILCAEADILLRITGGEGGDDAVAG